MKFQAIIKISREFTLGEKIIGNCFLRSPFFVSLNLFFKASAQMLHSIIINILKIIINKNILSFILL